MRGEALLAVAIVGILAVSLGALFAFQLSFPSELTGLAPLAPAVTTCGTISGASVLENDITTSGTCFTFGADDSVLDCAGFKITGDGTGYGVYSNSPGYDNLTIHNCTIVNFEHGIYLYNYAENCTVINNNVTGNTDRGIYIDWHGTSPVVENNTVTGNGGEGMRIGRYCTGANVTNNTVSGNGDEGIFIRIFSHNSTITRNTLSDNLYGIRVNGSLDCSVSFNNFTYIDQQLYLDESNRTEVHDNTFHTVAGAVTLSTSHQNHIWGNTVVNDSSTSIYLYDSNYNLVEDNVVDINTYIDTFWILGSHNRILNNNLTNMSGDGISFNRPFGSNDRNNTVAGNRVLNTTGNAYGIEVATSDGNNISGNTISSGGLCGILVDDTDNNTLEWNTISGYDHGIAIRDTSTGNNATHNTVSSYASRAVYVWKADSNLILDTTASGGGIGIELSEADQNNVSGGTLENGEYGVKLFNFSQGNTVEYVTSRYNKFGIGVRDSPYNNLTNNTLTGNYVGGINLWNSSGSGLVNNSVQSGAEYGIGIFGTNNTFAMNNTVTGNGENGFTVVMHSCHSLLTGNTVTGNTGSGVLFDFFSILNNVTQSTITGNSKWGVHLDFFSSNSTVSYNSLSGNTLGAYTETDFSVGNTFTGNT